jgi:DNA-binding MarR family transcriptional regulator
VTQKPDVSAAAAQVRHAAARLTWWTSRADVRRRLLGAVGELSANDAWLLGAIVAAEPVRVSDVARMQGVDKSTISPQLRRLEQRGLLTRTSDRSDGRVVLLRATSKGRQWQEELDTAGAAVFADVLRQWTPEEVTALATLLARFADHLTLDDVTGDSGGNKAAPG